MKKKSIFTFVFIPALLFLSFLYPGRGYAKENNDPRAVAIVTRILDNLAPGQWKGEYRFTNYRVDGTRKSYSLEVLAMDRSTVHVTFIAPPSDAGRQILNRNNEIWSFLPDSRKIVRLADRDSIGNGDFNNADVMKLDWLSDYTLHIIKESKKQLVIDMKARPDNGASYYLIRLWVDKSTNQPIQQYFYDQYGHHLKTLKYRKVRQFRNLTRPAHLIMENVITGQRTFLEIKDFMKKTGLPESRFRQENLGK